MKISCTFGFHKWVGCKCSTCGKTRNKGHDWSKDCESCSQCGKTRSNCHAWNSIRCTQCGKSRDPGNEKFVINTRKLDDSALVDKDGKMVGLWFNSREKANDSSLIAGVMVLHQMQGRTIDQSDFDACSKGLCSVTEHDGGFAVFFPSSTGRTRAVPNEAETLMDCDLFHLLGDRPIAMNVTVMFQTTRRVVGGSIRLVDLYFENGTVLCNVRIANERVVSIPKSFAAIPIKTVGVADLERHREAPPMRAESHDKT